MKRTFLILCMLSLIVSCSDNGGEQPTMEVGYPHEWVFTVGGETNPPQDPSVAEYQYIYTNKYAMFRDNILKSYPLKDLVEEENCLFYVAETNSSSGKKCYTIQLNNEKILFLGVGPSTNKEEMHLFIVSGSELVVIGNPTRIIPPDDEDEGGDYYKFYIHKMPDVNGVTTVAIESVGLPGWYISDSPPGFNYAKNVVTFQEAKSPESAPKWQCRSAK